MTEKIHSNSHTRNFVVKEIKVRILEYHFFTGAFVALRVINNF